MNCSYQLVYRTYKGGRRERISVITSEVDPKTCKWIKPTDEIIPCTGKIIASISLGNTCCCHDGSMDIEYECNKCNTSISSFALHEKYGLPLYNGEFLTTLLNEKLEGIK